MRSFGTILVCATLSLAAFGASGAQASTNLLANGGFEGPSLGLGNYAYPGATLQSWTYGGSALVNAQGGSAWYGAAPPTGQEGLQFAALQGLSTLSQAFTATSQTLKLTWLDAGRPYFGGYNGDQVYDVSLDGVSLNGYRTYSGQNFTAESLLLTGLNVGQTYTLAFDGFVNADETAFLDKVVLSGGVPEPATWAMMFMGFGLIGATLRAGPRRQVETAA
jgi:hypothetical protein